MADQSKLARTFTDLHVQGDPIILYNIWDAGTAQLVASLGAKAIATGSHGMANANGYEDGEQMPLETVLENLRSIIRVVPELPVTVDFETGYGDSPEAVQASVSSLIEAGAIGLNIEDQMLGQKKLRPTQDQADRIRAARKAADEAGVPIFINARTDTFRLTDPSTHAELFDQAVERAKAYADAGANGFFVPFIRNIDLIKRLCDASPLPVNVLMLPDLNITTQQLAEAGVARISYGPFPYIEMTEWLKTKAQKALA